MRFAIIIGAMIALTFAIMLYTMSTTFPHDWYEYSCCGAHGDCRPVNGGLIRDGEGYTYTPEGVYFPRDQIRMSKDANNHVCSYLTSNGYRGRCVYLATGL